MRIGCIPYFNQLPDMLTWIVHSVADIEPYTAGQSQNIVTHWLLHTRLAAVGYKLLEAARARQRGSLHTTADKIYGNMAGSLCEQYTLYALTPSSTALSRSSSVLSVLARRTTVETCTNQGASHCPLCNKISRPTRNH